MGQNNGKVLCYTTRTKNCRFCADAKRKGKTPKKHDCRINHYASSKAMEPTSAVYLFNKSLESKVKFSTYTGDDDSTTAAHIRENVPYPVEKWTDIIHAKRSLTARLINLSQRSKFENSSVLSLKVINYLARNFSYSVTQNKGDASNLKKSLKAIVPHAFGDHVHCQNKWCGAQTRQNYKHSDLPYGKDLHGIKLREALQRIFDDYCTDIVLEKLVPAANSQRNESLNGVIGSKDPKIRYYGGSESNDFRIACAISQLNLGYQYVSRTLESLDIAPGYYCIDHNKKMDEKSKKDKERKSTKKFKFNRSRMHKQKVQTNSQKEAKEGSTYQSNIGLHLNPNNSKQVSNVHAVNIINTNISNEQLRLFESQIPEYTIRPTPTKLSFDENSNYNFVIYDIETNTRGKKAEICQLSAIDESGHQTFNCYILPSRDVDNSATRVNGLTVRLINGCRTLYKDNKPVVTVPLEKAQSDFLSFIHETITNKNSKSQESTINTVLIGHNSQVFDAPTLIRHGKNRFSSKLIALNVYFADTLPLVKDLIRSEHPSLKSADGSMSKANQSALYEQLFGESFDAHDALEDVKALRRIVFASSLEFPPQKLTTSMVSTSHVVEDTAYLDRRHEILQSFKGKLYLENSKEYPISKQMAEKIAGSGLSYDDLLNTFTKFGETGLIAVLSCPPKSSAKVPRVTKNTRILTQIIQYFKLIHKE